MSKSHEGSFAPSKSVHKRLNVQTGKPMDIEGFPVVDVTVQPEGKIFLFHLNTLAAKEWVKEHVDGEAQFWGGALVVEDRYVGVIAAAMANDGGLVVQ